MALLLLPARLPETPLGLMLLFVVVMTFLFGSLTIQIGEGRLQWRFGLGFFGRSVPLAEIRDMTIVQNPWYYGWGIRLTPHGWLYNVSGLDAVEVTLISGRRFRLGTDEPAILLAALREAASDR